MEAELKGLDEITNIINEFLREWDFDLTAEPDTDFAYYHFRNLITYSLVEMDNMGKEFLAFVEKRFPDIHAPLFLWSLFHEIFHSETFDDLEDEDFFISDEMKAAAIKTGDNTLYFSAPVEIVATSAAAYFMRNAQAEVASFWEELKPAIRNFYILNNIEED